MRKLGKRIGILAAPLLLFSAVLAAQAPSAHAATRVFAMYFDHTTNCLVDNGGSPLLQTDCPPPPSVIGVNHVGLWYADPEGIDSISGKEMYRLRNVHDSTRCITQAGDGGFYMDTCGTNHVQFWEFEADPGGGYQDVHNVHYLQFDLQVTGTGSPVWHFVPTNV